ncbi:group II truncated hemoglobin [Neisseria yangbaofengii]|uniref:group II truncated hemoglobin n=1 Tax=Neisseria yangbaofengii TaxID=2709396 RepID=UPI0013EAE2C6|nr:group II truncated hemoglobin [Neisseria yangbaofengii]
MYQALGGAQGVRALTDRFYDLMELEPKYQALREMHGEDMALIRDKLYEFFSGWLGGPPLFEQKYGHPQLRARHMPFAVKSRVRDEWVACFAQALGELEIDKKLAEPLLLQIYAMADWMRNQYEDGVAPPMPPGASSPEDRLAALQEILPRYDVNGFFQAA